MAPDLLAVSAFAGALCSPTPILWAKNPKVKIDSHSTPITCFQGFLKAPLSCHSCLVINYIASNRYAHNPKVGGSNPSPATKTNQNRTGFLERAIFVRLALPAPNSSTGRCAWWFLDRQIYPASHRVLEPHTARRPKETCLAQKGFGTIAGQRGRPPNQAPDCWARNHW